MAFDTHKNLAYSTVLTAPSPATSGTSLVVQSGDGTKFGTSMNCTVWPAGAVPTTANAEIVRITAISTDTFTITRIQESTSARTIVAGDQIANTITAKLLTDIETGFVDLTTGQSVGGNKTFSDDVTVSGTFSGGAGNIQASTAGSIIFGDNITIASNVSTSISGFVPFSAPARYDNASFGPSISGGEIIYSNTDCLFFLDGGASDQTIYLNYDAGSGWTTIRNVGTTNNITIDNDGAGAYTMTPVTLTPGQYATFAQYTSTGDILRIG